MKHTKKRCSATRLVCTSALDRSCDLTCSRRRRFDESVGNRVMLLASSSQIFSSVALAHGACSVWPKPLLLYTIHKYYLLLHFFELIHRLRSTHVECHLLIFLCLCWRRRASSVPLAGGTHWVYGSVRIRNYFEFISALTTHVRFIAIQTVWHNNCTIHIDPNCWSTVILY